MKLEIDIDGERRQIELNAAAGKFKLEIDGRTIEGEFLRPESDVFTFYIGDRVVEARVAEMAAMGAAYRVQIGGTGRDVRVVDRRNRDAIGDVSAEGRQSLIAPMPGKVVAVLVSPGQEVERNQGVLVVEAMKMQNEVKAPKAGVVAEVRVAPGDAVTAGQVLAIID